MAKIWQQKCIFVVGKATRNAGKFSKTQYVIEETKCYFSVGKRFWKIINNKIRIQ